ncbi:hypothetical protein MMF93_21195 [Streptomyces tubbatahanensis]|uniref:Uncharacterized protein n=1 Tax=Streptomyces tubbatahanensis TaxID=2923272 RepID=A0ABY3XWP4_9ACTN|nr:hypothetical protein [Streptomyces tubbatahanensis]UNS98693.1 hypothetical protein MMF93_21195 [Streptomyces tubbatahanensis]
MSTALAVTSPDHLLAPPDRHTPRAHVLTPPGEQSLQAALDETHALLEQHGYLVTLYPASLPTPFLHRLHTVRALLDSRRIALLPVPLPPLATGVLVRQLRQLSLCDFSPGVLGAAARLLTHYVYAGAVLGSVAKLDRVPVTVGSHARSWLPGSQFAVLASPTPELLRIGGAQESERGLTGPQFATDMTVAHGRLGSDWASRTLPARWRAGQVAQAPLPADSPAWWGTDKLTEFAAAIPDVSVLYQLVASVRRDTCHGCGLELIGDRCAFCATALSPAPPAALSSAPATPSPTHTPPTHTPPTPATHAPAHEPPAPDAAPASPPSGPGVAGRHADERPVVADPRGIRP